MLEYIAELRLPNFYIAAGCVFQTVWNYQDGRDLNYEVKDLDVIYYHPEDLSIDTDMKYYEMIQEYEVVLNGKEQNMNIIYTQEKDELGIETITGSLGNETVYLDMYDTPNEETAFNINRINQNFNEQNFQIIKGSDNKSYLVIASMLNYPTGIRMNYEIYNDNLNKLNQESIPLYTSMQCISNNLEIEPFENEYVELYNLNSDNSCYRIRGKIENNQIYSLFYNYDETLQYKVYTINNDKVEYRVLRTFENLIISGEV